MNFKHDFAELLKTEMMKRGVVVQNSWDEYQICLNYVELNQRWIDDNVSYEVVYSKELMDKIPSLSIEEQLAIKDIESCLKQCRPLNLYMSKLIYKTDMRHSDFLLKNWNIYHLHLEKLVFPKIRFTKSNLLFFQPKGRIMHFIDVKPHPSGATWFDRNLLEIIYANWPWLLQYLKEVKPNESIPDCEVHNLTKRIVTILDFHGGALIPSNFGVATSGNSFLAVQKTNRILNSLRDCENRLRNEENSIRNIIYKELRRKVSEQLDYSLIIENGYLVACEKYSGLKIQLFKL